MGMGMCIKVKILLCIPILLSLIACENQPKRKETYQIVGRNGVTYRVHGPPGLSREQIVADVLRKYPEAAFTVTYAPTFYGYQCTGDCSGHQAGYDWAEENSVYDPDDCSGNSQSFVEGCRAYGEELGY